MVDKIVQAILQAWMKHPDPQKPTEINKFKVSFRTFEKSFKHLFGPYHLIDIYPWRLKEYIYLDKTIREGPVVSCGVGGTPVECSPHSLPPLLPPTLFFVAISRSTSLFSFVHRRFKS